MIGLTGNAGCGTGVAENIGFFLCTDWNGKVSIGVYSVSSVGAFVGMSVSGGIEVTIAPFADDFSCIEDFSISVGGSGVFSGFLSLGGEIGYNPTAKTFSEKLKSLTISVSLTGGIPKNLPVEGHMYTNYTKKMAEWRLFDSKKVEDIQNNLIEFLNNKDYEGLGDYLNILMKEVEHD